MIKFEFSGFENIDKEIRRKANALSGNVQISELLTDEFMSENTRLNTYIEFFDLCDIETVEDYHEASEEDLDRCVLDISEFSTWQDMINSAAVAYYSKHWDDA